MMNDRLTEAFAREESPLRTSFLKWQCRVRQMAMRDGHGRPDGAITPDLYLPGQAEAMGSIITLVNRREPFSVLPEFEHMLAKTNDPAQRREQAIRFLSANYFQRASEFSDILTATFPADSKGAETIYQAGEVQLVFEAYARRFDLVCKVWRLTRDDALCRMTLAHNRLFNPSMAPDTQVLGFGPDWRRSTSHDAMGSQSDVNVDAGRIAGAREGISGDASDSAQQRGDDANRAATGG